MLMAPQTAMMQAVSKLHDEEEVMKQEKMMLQQIKGGGRDGDNDGDGCKSSDTAELAGDTMHTKSFILREVNDRFLSLSLKFILN